MQARPPWRGFALGRLFWAVAVLWAGPAQAQDDAKRLHLGALRLHVLYSDSGQLSPDLLEGDGPRETWNLTIGSGGLAGRADHAMVVLPILADKDASGDGQAYSTIPIAIRVRDRAGKVIAQRRIAGALTSHDGRSFEPLWLPDITCAGPIAIEATMAQQRVTATFAFHCGE